MPAGLDQLKHIVVLMMENRSFDHMLGALKAEDPRINGLTGNESNPDTTNEPAKVAPLAQFQSQLDPDPDHHFIAVNKQLYFGTPGPPAAPAMQGFVQSYFDQRRDIKHSRKIMYYFKPDKLPVLTTLARNFALFNGWFASIPGPTICNRAFAHYGTSFGSVGMNPFEIKAPYLSMYDRMVKAGEDLKLYYYDQASSTMEVVNLLGNQPHIFGSYDQFLADCKLNELPDYSFIEPNYKDHEGESGGELLASDQHPDHDVQAVRSSSPPYTMPSVNEQLWKHRPAGCHDERGGIYGHVSPPRATPMDSRRRSRIRAEWLFKFNRLGVRVPAILISPWIPKAMVVPGPENVANGRVFEHASIPATVTERFSRTLRARSPREKKAATFLDLLSDNMRPDNDCPVFHFE